ncbi:hypothetical protein N9Z23_01970, partial [Akkermansiaceae bacterium]|nr:hypothetical protein [Akkermansiaceae bacterium]MDB4370036.1 hypothetical protein [Akkermansiaceae bacterium]
MRAPTALCLALTLTVTPLTAGDFTDAVTNTYATRPSGNPGAVAFDANLQFRTAAGGLDIIDAATRTDDAYWHNFGSDEAPDWKVKIQTYTRLEYVDALSIGSTVNVSGYLGWYTLGADPGSIANESAIQRYYAANSLAVSDDVRIYQMLGLPDSSGSQTRVLAQYWVSPDALIRPGYNWDIGGNEAPANYDSNNPTSAYGLIAETWDLPSFNMILSGAGGSTVTISSGINWASWLANQQQNNTYPWTQMGYTMDWGYDTDPLDAANREGAGYDTFGISEFVLMNDTDTIFAGYIAPSDLTPYLNNSAPVQLVPEPTALGLL